MAFTATDLAAIEAAIVAAAQRPEQVVRFSDGREVTYRSLKEMFDARDRIKAAASASSGGTRCTFAQFSKG